MPAHLVPAKRFARKAPFVGRALEFNPHNQGNPGLHVADGQKARLARLASLKLTGHDGTLIALDAPTTPLEKAFDLLGYVGFGHCHEAPRILPGRWYDSLRCKL